MIVLFVWLWLFALSFSRALDATLWVIRAGRHLVVILKCFFFVLGLLRLVARGGLPLSSGGWPVHFGGLHFLGRRCHSFDGRPVLCKRTLMPQHPRWKKLHSGCVRRVVILVLARY